MKNTKPKYTQTVIGNNNVTNAGNIGGDITIGAAKEIIGEMAEMNRKLVLLENESALKDEIITALRNELAICKEMITFLQNKK